MAIRARGVCNASIIDKTTKELPSHLPPPSRGRRRKRRGHARLDRREVLSPQHLLAAVQDLIEHLLPVCIEGHVTLVVFLVLVLAAFVVVCACITQMVMEKMMIVPHRPISNRTTTTDSQTNAHCARRMATSSSRS